jgi:hypothetical protein
MPIVSLGILCVSSLLDTMPYSNLQSDGGKGLLFQNSSGCGILWKTGK